MEGKQKQDISYRRARKKDGMRYRRARNMAEEDCVWVIAGIWELGQKRRNRDRRTQRKRRESKSHWDRDWGNNTSHISWWLRSVKDGESTEVRTRAMPQSQSHAVTYCSAICGSSTIYCLTSYNWPSMTDTASAGWFSHSILHISLHIPASVLNIAEMFFFTSQSLLWRQYKLCVHS